jgi:hypothetical protein
LSKTAINIKRENSKKKKKGDEGKKTAIEAGIIAKKGGVRIDRGDSGNNLTKKKDKKDNI